MRGRIMFNPQEAITSYHHQPVRYQDPPALFYEQRRNRLQLWAPKAASWPRSQGVGQGDGRCKKEPSLGSVGRDGARWRKSSCLSQVDVQLSGVKLLFCLLGLPRQPGQASCEEPGSATLWKLQGPAGCRYFQLDQAQSNFIFIRNVPWPYHMCKPTWNHQEGSLPQLSYLAQVQLPSRTVSYPSP